MLSTVDSRYNHRHRFWGGWHPLVSDTEWGEICLAPLSFLASNTHLVRRNPKFWTEIEPECTENLFFYWSLSEFVGKILYRNKIIKFNQTLQKPFCSLGICLINKNMMPIQI